MHSTARNPTLFSVSFPILPRPVSKSESAPPNPKSINQSRSARGFVPSAVGVGAGAVSRPAIWFQGSRGVGLESCLLPVRT